MPSTIPEHESAKSFKRYYLISLILMCVVNRVTYEAGRAVGHFFSPHDMALPLDGRIRLIPWTILIYLGCFLWWVWIFRYVSRRERARADRFCTALILAHVFCALVFAVYPTTIARPELSGDSLWILLLRLLYRADEPNNLFPSVHCMIGWLCWIVIRGDRNVPLVWRISSLLWAVAVCVSPLTTRPHVFLDIFGGIAVAEITWLITRIPALNRPYARLMDRLA